MAAVSEGARDDLYNGLSGVLGRERAETLMSYLPRYDQQAVATRSDMDELRREIAELRTVTSSQAAALLSLQGSLITGFIAMFAAMAGIFVAVL